MPVGDRYVLEEMLRSGANLGGEQSGHIIFLDDATTGDGLLTALKIACLVALRGPLDDLVRGLKVFPQTIVNVNSEIEAAARIPALGFRRNRQSHQDAWAQPGGLLCAIPAPNPKRASWSKPNDAEDVTLWAETLASAIRTAIGA